MTRQRFDDHSTEFGLWIRNQPVLGSVNFDCQNLDYIWFAYRDGWLITIEEKRYNGKSSLAQNDTHNLIKQMLEFASGQEYQTLRGKRSIHYKGHYLIQFENTNPEDGWIKINGEIVTKNELTLFLYSGQFVKVENQSTSELAKEANISIDIARQIRNV